MISPEGQLEEQIVANLSRINHIAHAAGSGTTQILCQATTLLKETDVD
jgi:hypothetical protein